MVDIDADAPENADVKPELEPGEFIDVFMVPFEGLHRSLVVSLCHPNLLTGVLISVHSSVCGMHHNSRDDGLVHVSDAAKHRADRLPKRWLSQIKTALTLQKLKLQADCNSFHCCPLRSRLSISC